MTKKNLVILVQKEKEKKPTAFVIDLDGFVCTHCTHKIRLVRFKHDANDFCTNLHIHQCIHKTKFSTNLESILGVSEGK